MDGRTLSLLYQRAHDRMRDVEGILPQEAFDELLKFLFYKDCSEMYRDSYSASHDNRPHEDPATIRQKLMKDLSYHAPWARTLWPGGFHLTDGTLDHIRQLFADVQLTSLPIDVRSTALSTFLTSNVRKSLGIFPTPTDVVRSMVEIIAPSSDEVIMDPACGTGTFLTEAMRFISLRQPQMRPVTVYGADKNPRMLFLADFNLRHQDDVIFRRACVDSLCRLDQPDPTLLGLAPNSVDVILTNPPFGVTVTREASNLSLFNRGTASPVKEPNRIPSEVLFVELCLTMLRPGGRLGIVLPRSVITNDNISLRRQEIDQKGHLTEVIDLPPETFASTGTQTTTVAAFFRKHSSTNVRGRVSVRVCHVTNVGFDTTGRPKDGNQLPGLATRLSSEPVPVGQPTVTTYSDISSTETLQRAAHFLFRRNGNRVGKRLREFIESATTGRTPRRNTYTDHGVFILKVGNLTGRGIDWEPRDRNFVSRQEGRRRIESGNLDVVKDDIFLTSSAHAARYIAKKVDIATRIPDQYKRMTFVGEVIRVRPARGVDPFLLLAILRHPRIREDLQACVRGQTAHLNPSDLMEVRSPYDLGSPANELAEVAMLLRREAYLAFELSSVAVRAAQLLKSSSTTSIGSGLR